MFNFARDLHGIDVDDEDGKDLESTYFCCFLDYKDSIYFC